MRHEFSAVLVGGPPHSGKSVLTYSLTQALRRRQVSHYVLRACPDGEGDWSMESPPDTVRLLRDKGLFTDQWVDRICRDLQQRHLPLLVDVGGRPTANQQRILGCCTHALLLAADPAALPEWRDMMEQQGVAVVAELISTLDGTEAVEGQGAVLRGRIAGLHRFCTVQGELFDALVERLVSLLQTDQATLSEAHLRMAPTELAVDLERLGRTLELLDPGSHRWHPAALPPLLEYLPAHEPLAVYGRGPGWLYAALSAYTWPAPFWQFDPRLGWVAPATLHRLKAGTSPIVWRVAGGAGPILEAVLNTAYVEHTELEGTGVPDIDVSGGLVFSGKLPYWVLTGLVRSYTDAPWIAAYRPQEENAIVVVARGFAHRVGDILDLKRWV
jgi:CRISPR-associated protein Csx3